MYLRIKLVNGLQEPFWTVELFKSSVMVSRPYSKQKIVAKTFAKSWTWINQPELASRA